MSTPVQDLYPTRISDTPAWQERVDPVVHGNAKGPLTADQLAQFERSGYLFLDALFTREEVAFLQEELESLRYNEEVRQSEISITEPASGVIRSIFAVPTVSDVFGTLARDKRLLRVARQLLGGDVYLHQTRLNLKPGFEGKEFYWHSDFETWHAEDGMPRMRAVSFSISLTDNHPHNGPLMIIPGSHRVFVPCIGETPDDHYRASLKRQEFGVPDRESLTKLAERHGIEAPIGPAGSVLIFDCNVVHGSNSNITPYPRSNAFFVYNSVENRLAAPFAADTERPWFLGEREAEPLEEASLRDVAKTGEPASV